MAQNTGRMPHPKAIRAPQGHRLAKLMELQ
jgi:hypothetical protein